VREPARGPVLVAHIDGGARGNPGPAGYGVHVADARGATRAEIYGYLGVATNNVAEYAALLALLEHAGAVGAADLTIYSDSELLVRQMAGEYRVKEPRLRILHAEARRLLAGLPRVAIRHVRREANRAADALANRAMDLRESSGPLPEALRRLPAPVRPPAAWLIAVLLAGLQGACGDDRGPARLVPVEGPILRVGVRDGAPLYRKSVLTPVFVVDRVYRSMQGPLTVHRFEIDPAAPSELLWVTGYDAVMVGADGERPVSQEFMCHSNLSIRPGPGFVHEFPSRLRPSAGRLFTLAQGQLSIRLPEGFAVPALSNQTLQIAAQVLNHNEVSGRPFEVRQKISVEFVRDRERCAPLVPLMPRAVFGMKLVDGPDDYFGVPPAAIDGDLHGEGCQVGVDVRSPFPSLLDDDRGRRFTAHWVVRPGREENHTLVTRLLDLPYDTALHYVAVHLHLFAETIELRDLTAGRTLVRTAARQAAGRIGLEEVEYFSSAEGIPLRRYHEYAVISVYDNTSGVDQDAMATMFLYLAVQDLDLSPYR
jgi:probable phosphoglycerate mutase